MNTYFNKFLNALDRMNQPSSWAGYAGLAVAFGISDTQWAHYSAILAAACGLIAVIRNDNSGTPPA